jgi:activator of 2-hydroxyglutaryl-CoA dehydratase
MAFVGIDVGSVAAKAVVMQDHQICSSVIEPTGWSPKNSGRLVYEKVLREAGLSQEDVKKVVGTGYGRVSLDFIDSGSNRDYLPRHGSKLLVS